MKFETVDFKGGRITYNELSLITDVPVMKQILLLKEDLLQVEYDKHILLDVGWFPSFDPSGKFQVRIVQGNKWDDPVLYLETSELGVLNSLLDAIAKLCCQLSEFDTK